MTLERSAENLLCQLKITLGTIQQFARDNPIIDIPIFRTAVSILSGTKLPISGHAQIGKQ
ncbi:hypothetical protein KAM471c_28020 [Aeromonas caviae]|nr:hypothetical protein KAM471c_28020 [Aeromonas caviae]GKR36866.1 hypothetical protein KAM471_26300 [Aeromonas caviae]